MIQLQNTSKKIESRHVKEFNSVFIVKLTELILTLETKNIGLGRNWATSKTVRPEYCM